MNAPRDTAESVLPRCGAEHPTNATVVPCVLLIDHEGLHYSTTGCAGSGIKWADEPETAESGLHRDLVSRLGFGDNITEPMADNDTIVAWFEEQGRDATEWHESQSWRNDCAAAGCPDDEDCYEHDPWLIREREHLAVLVGLVDRFIGYQRQVRAIVRPRAMDRREANVWDVAIWDVKALLPESLRRDEAARDALRSTSVTTPVVGNS